ncbi:hypothetical protein ACB087_04160 [Vibrio sp. VNB-15]
MAKKKKSAVGLDANGKLKKGYKYKKGGGVVKVGTTTKRKATKK